MDESSRPRGTCVIELRDYLLAPGATSAFIRFFEEQFLFSQRLEGMRVLGQFEVADDPLHFFWIRAFDDMEARLRGLTRFYGGTFWGQHRAAANAMIRDNDHVHLLRSLGPERALTGGLSLEDRAAEPPGAPGPGLIAIDFWKTPPGELQHTIDRFDAELAERLAAQGPVGHFISETTPNDFPRLPAFQDPDLFAVLSSWPDRTRHRAVMAGWCPGEHTTRYLLPTARSLIAGVEEDQRSTAARRRTSG